MTCIFLNTHIVFGIDQVLYKMVPVLLVLFLYKNYNVSTALSTVFVGYPWNKYPVHFACTASLVICSQDLCMTTETHTLYKQHEHEAVNKTTGEKSNGF